MIALFKSRLSVVLCVFAVLAGCQLNAGMQHTQTMPHPLIHQYLPRTQRMINIFRNIPGQTLDVINMSFYYLVICCNPQCFN